MYSNTRFWYKRTRDVIIKVCTFNRCNFSTKSRIFCCVVPELSSLFLFVIFSRFFLYFRQNSRNLQNLKNLLTLMVCFHCPAPMPIPIPILCRKAPLGLIPMVIPMQSYYENYFKNHLIGTDIGVKLGTVPICIRIGIGIGSVETVLHIIILAI